jgi:NAD(P)-dependent dehydrogenase (short-subunit alcohol dehydrogenase family)
MRLDGAVALVTGSSKGVGRAIALLQWAGYGNIAKAGRQLAAQPAQALALIGIEFEN